MSTRSVICARRLDGRPQVNYIHFDGYPDRNGVGARLLAHYATPEAVEALMARGDLNALGEKPDACEQTEGDGPMYPCAGDEGEALGQTLLRTVENGWDLEWAYLFDGRAWECMASPSRREQWHGVSVEEEIRRKGIWDKAPFDDFETASAQNTAAALQTLRKLAAETGESEDPWWFSHAAGLAAYGNNREGLKTLLGFAEEMLPGADRPEARAAGGALNFAINSPRLEEETVQKLLDAGADPNFSDGPGIPSILHKALDWGYAIKPGVVTRLIESGADVEAPRDIVVGARETALERMRGLNGWVPMVGTPAVNLEEAIKAAERQQAERQAGEDLPSPTP